MSAIPDGLTELEVFQPIKEEKSHPPPPPLSVPSQNQEDHDPKEKLLLGEAIFKDNRDTSKSKQVGSFSQLQSAGPEVVQEKSKLQPVYPCNLSTITEESGSYKSSSSSGSRLTVSSASSK